MEIEEGNFVGEHKNPAVGGSRRSGAMRRGSIAALVKEMFEAKLFLDRDAFIKGIQRVGGMPIPN